MSDEDGVSSFFYDTSFLGTDFVPARIERQVRILRRRRIRKVFRVLRGMVLGNYGFCVGPPGDVPGGVFFAA